ncbi:hypothetical protein Gotur_001517 [Gossypium turneri]
MLPVSTYYYPFFHYLNGDDCSGGGGGFDWFFVGKQEPIVATYFIPNHNLSNPNFYPKNVLTDELRLKIIKQSRTIVVENLPEDYSHQNLNKIFNVVGRVKNIQKCRPQESNSRRSKTDFSTSNKVHRATLSRAKHFEKAADSQSENALTEDIGVGSKKGGGKGRGKGRGRVQNHNRRGQLPTSPQPINPTTQCEASMKQTFKGPRIPDGTKGFTMGRGKPLTSYFRVKNDT